MYFFWGIFEVFFFIILHILKVVAVGAWDVFLLDDPRYFRTIGKYFPADGPRNRNLLFATKDILYFLSPTFFSSKPCLFSYFLPSHWLHIKTDDDDSIILATVFSTHTTFYFSHWNFWLKAFPPKFSSSLPVVYTHIVIGPSICIFSH